MRIDELIKKLEEIKNKEGNLRVTIFDEYTDSEGWDYKNQDLWLDTNPVVEMVEDDQNNKIEKVICFR